MEKREFVLALMSILMGGMIVTTLITTIGKAFMRRRESPSALGDAAVAQLDHRLSRMEQAIDAMSLEVERISEGQRFTTKLLSERSMERQHG